jgi:hypothetical protein
MYGEILPSLRTIILFPFRGTDKCVPSSERYPPVRAYQTLPKIIE